MQIKYHNTNYSLKINYEINYKKIIKEIPQHSHIGNYGGEYQLKAQKNNYKI